MKFFAKVVGFLFRDLTNLFKYPLSLSLFSHILRGAILNMASHTNTKEKLTIVNNEINVLEATIISEN